MKLYPRFIVGVEMDLVVEVGTPGVNVIKLFSVVIYEFL